MVMSHGLAGPDDGELCGIPVDAIKQRFSARVIPCFRMIANYGQSFP